MSYFKILSTGLFASSILHLYFYSAHAAGLPVFDPDIYDSGEPQRHHQKLCSDIDSALKEYENRSVQHIGLEHALEEANHFSHHVFDFDGYMEFLSKYEGLFNQHRIEIDKIPNGTKRYKTISIFILPIIPDSFSRYVNNIKGQLLEIQEINSSKRIENLTVKRLLREISCAPTRTKLLDAYLSKFINENHTFLRRVGVVDPRDRGFREQISSVAQREIVLETRQ